MRNAILNNETNTVFMLYINQKLKYGINEQHN